jgi:hypothetical protein
MSTILGYDTKSPSPRFSLATGRKFSSKATLASPGVLTELHGWFTKASNRVVLHVYADNSGVPGALVAYSAPVDISGSGDIQVSVTGLSVNLSAGDYWVGFTAENDGGNVYGASSGGSLRGILGGATFSPPSDPYGTTNHSDSTRLSIWGVVDDPPSSPVAAFTGTPTSGAAPLTVQFTDESTNTPTSWDWDFGDTNTSTDQHPEHEYTTPGSYTVGLEVTNAGGSDDEVKAGYITVTGSEPGIEGFSVAFDDPALEPDPTWTRLA